MATSSPTGSREHRYTVNVEWTGNRGTGTATYRGYDRRHEISAPGLPKSPIAGSSDRSFRGDASCWNPEELLIASLSACHKLWYLHLCAEADVVVDSYVDHASGSMVEEADGGGHFREVVLRPVIHLSAESDEALARRLHDRAHALCFIARSVNFPVKHEPEIRRASA
jgi:organic hydroperoxide reductase OsmC/OhrA